jgi:hypothetical protein
MNFNAVPAPQTPLPQFSVSSNSPPVPSVEILVLAYKAQCHILHVVYGPNNVPSRTSLPPSEIASSDIVPFLLTPAAIGLLSQTKYANAMLQVHSRTSTFPSIESLILPVLENLSQVWPAAGGSASKLRLLMSQIRTSLLQASKSGSSHPMQASATNGAYSQPRTSMPVRVSVTVNDMPKEPSWQDFQNEFEDEFLL